MSIETPRILVLTAGGMNPQVMINALKPHFPNLEVIEETYESKSSILKRRARKLGWAVALGQLATMVWSRLGKRMAARRSAEILSEFGLSDEPDTSIPRTHVTSLNSAEAIEAIQRAEPDVVFTVSCRLLTRKTLEAVSCPIINFHAGINPAYRGQMGGYWSLVEKDEANFGGTLHLVDAGTDTGATLAEVRGKPHKRDTISTYPLLITALGVKPTIEVLSKALSGQLIERQLTGPSRLRFPPPLWTYLYVGLTRSIW